MKESLREEPSPGDNESLPSRWSADPRGRFRFIPPKGSSPSNPVKGSHGGWIDRFGNEWVKGPAHHFPGDPFEWDVQLLRRGYYNVSKHGVVA